MENSCCRNSGRTLVMLRIYQYTVLFGSLYILRRQIKVSWKRLQESITMYEGLKYYYNCNVNLQRFHLGKELNYSFCFSAWILVINIIFHQFWGDFQFDAKLSLNRTHTHKTNTKKVWNKRHHVNFFKYYYIVYRV